MTSHSHSHRSEAGHRGFARWLIGAIVIAIVIALAALFVRVIKPNRSGSSVTPNAFSK